MGNKVKRSLALILAVVMCIGNCGCGSTFMATEEAEPGYEGGTPVTTEEIVVSAAEPTGEPAGEPEGEPAGEPTTEPTPAGKEEKIKESEAEKTGSDLVMSFGAELESAADILTVEYCDASEAVVKTATFEIVDGKVLIADIAREAPYVLGDYATSLPGMSIGGNNGDSILIGDWFAARTIRVYPVVEQPAEPDLNEVKVTYVDESDEYIVRQILKGFIVDGNKISLNSILSFVPKGYEFVSISKGEETAAGVTPVDGEIVAVCKLKDTEPVELTYTIVYKAEGEAEALDRVKKTAEVAADAESYTLDNEKDIEIKTYEKYVIKEGELDKERTVADGGETEVLYREKTYREKLVEYADSILTDDNPRGLVSIKKTTSGSEYKAGQELEYKLQYQFKEIPVWGGGKGLDNDQPIFATYDTEVSFTLPAGMRLVSVYEGFEIASSVENADGSTTYTASVKKCAAIADGGTIKVYLAGNGSEESIRSYGDLKAELNYDMELIDRQTGDSFGAVYNQHVESTTPGVTTTTEDRWGIKKVAIGEPALDKANMTMTVTYMVSLGLMRVNEQGELVMIESPSDYNRVGRVQVENMKLQEALTATLKDPAGVSKGDVELLSATIKNTSRSDDPLAFSNNGEIDIVKTVRDAETGEKTVTGLQLATTTVNTDYTYATGAYTQTEVPVFTQYEVTAVYQVTDAMIAQYYERANSIAFGNTVTLEDYELTGIEGELDGSSAEAGENGQLWLKDPVKLSIVKNLDSYKGGRIAYKGSDQENKYGEIGYTLTAEKPFKVYTYDKETNIYTCISGEDPVTSFAVNDDTAYYLDPGITYTVSEDLTAEQSKYMRLDAEKSTDLTKTPVAKEEWTARVINEETAADIHIVKKDNTDIAVKGATFTLYSKDDNAEGGYTEYGKVTTDKNGKADFTKVPYGEYKLVETGVPAGYIKAAEQTFTISSTNAKDFSGNAIVDERTAADIQLTKLLGVAEAEVTAKANSKYEGKFALERSTDKGATMWETVTTDVYGQPIATKVDDNGHITARVPAKDADKNVYYYRFRETSIPDGYYAPNGDTTESTTLIVNGQIAKSAVNVDLVNRKSVDLTATKEFLKVQADGALVAETGKTATVQLYRYTGEQPTTEDKLTAVGTAQTIGEYKWEKLPLYEGDSEIHYLIKETAGEANYLLDGAVTIGDGVYAPVSLKAISGNAISVTMRNVEQVVPVVITKENYFTEKFVAGSKVTIKDAEGFVATDARDSSKSLENAEIPETGLTVWLRPGQTYSFEETGVPANYTLETYRYGDTESKTSGQLDLNDPQTFNNHYAASGVVVNRPYPDVRIVKTDSKTGAAVSGAVYTVYTKESGVYTPVTDASGAAVTISGNSTSTQARLEPNKDYYFAETTVPSGYLDPNAEWVYERFLKNDSTYVRGTVGDGEGAVTYTFAKGRVTDMEKDGTKDNVCTFTFSNIKNSGDITVKKYIDNVLAEGVPGFKVEFHPAGASSYSYAATENKGTVTISLKVYDAEGNKIVYTVKEGALTAEQQNTYYKVDENASQEAELKLGETVSTDRNGKELRIDNATLVQVKTGKVRINTWEYDFTGIAYLMPDVEVGLYQQQDDGSWTWLETGKTDGMGALTFASKLRRDGTYAAVEISAPAEYRMVPEGDKAYAVGDDGKALPSIAAGDLDNYNYKLVPDSEEDGLKDTSETIISTERLRNVNHWVQFDITKWKDADKLGDVIPGTDPEQTLTRDSMPAVDESRDTLYDNAVFALYRYIVPADATSTELTFDPATWTLVGTYTSGTEYSKDDDTRMSGQFRTDIEQGVDTSYVYVLVETSAGPGGAETYTPYEKTFYHAEGTNYSCKGISRDKTYQLDHVNEDDILNATPSGDGDGEPMLASMRLAKWATEYDAEGKLITPYTPLPNAKFELRLPDGTVIAELTSGLDATKTGTVGADKAWAQSGIFQLKEGEKAGTWDLINYEDENNPKTYSVAVEILKEADGYKVYGIKTQLYEVEAPEDYGYSLTGCDMYLAFVDKSADGKRTGTWYFNDAYFVKTADAPVDLAENQKDTAWYLTDAKNESSTIGDTQWRILDYKTKNSAVTLTKYGYLPTEATIGKTSAELDRMNIPSRKALNGITMVIEHQKADGSWEKWNYKKNEATTNANLATFVTGANGSFVFPEGLPMGSYRVYETNLGDYAEKYENAYPSSRAREFYVGGQTVQVTMYNPEKVDLSIVKKGTDGKLLKGVTFTLTSRTTGVDTRSEKTNASGQATFSDIASGKYFMSETDMPTGYTNSSLSAYLKSIGYEALVNNNGTLIGYSYGQVTDTKDGKTLSKDSVISAIGLTGTSLDLEIVNPQTVKLILSKEDEQTGKPLAGATFKMYRKLFSTTIWSGEMDLSKSLDLSGWSTGTSSTYVKTSGSDGTVTYSGYKPGVYAFVETAAPAGYDILKDVDGNPIVYYMVVTGGLDINVTGLPETATVKRVDGTTEEITIKAESKGNTVEEPITVANREKVEVSVAKDVDFGKLTDEQAAEYAWSVRLALYEAATGGSPVATAEISSKGSTTVEAAFTDAAGNAKVLSLGETYYLEETVTSRPESDYAPILVTKDGEPVTKDAGGRYPIMVTSLDPIAIAVTNQYKRGEVTFVKYDDDKGVENSANWLSGAKFEVRYLKDGEWVKVSGSNVTEISVNIDGKNYPQYVADIPLQTAEPAAEMTYRICETEAAPHYLTDADSYFEVELSWDDNVKAYALGEDGKPNGYEIANTRGDRITLVKYGNLASATGENVQEVTSGVEFWLVKLNGEKWETVGNSESVRSGGISYLVAPGATYGIIEYRSSDGFHGIDKVIANGNEIIPGLGDIITIDGTDYPVYSLGALGIWAEDLAVKVYNNPKLSVKVIKDDIGKYPENVIPAAEYSIYEIADNFAGDRDTVEKFLGSETKPEPIYTGTTGKVDGKKTYDIWNERDANKRYLVVETKVLPSSESPDSHYNTLNKDYDGVVWYGIVEPSGDPKLSEPAVVELHNVYSTAEAGITKTGTERIDSLLLGDQTIHYEITPTAGSHNQALNSYVLTDEGLSFEYKSYGDKPAEQLPVEYAITNLSTAASKQSFAQFKESIRTGVADAGITETIRFFDGAGAQIGDALSLDAGTDQNITDIPAGARSFTIEYSCDELRQATSEYAEDGTQVPNTGYGLGYDFTPGKVTFDVTVNAQRDGTKENPIAELSEITNKADVDLTYRKWADDGSKTTLETSHADDTAETVVNSVELPRVRVGKTSDPTAQVLPGQKVKYTISITNLDWEHVGSKADFHDPVVLDMLPSGFSFDPDAEIVVSNGLTCTKTSRFTGSALDAEIGDAETAVAFELSGTIKPGETATVTFGTIASDTLFLYGTTAENCAYLSSSKYSYHTGDNPNGYSFENDIGDFAENLKDAAKTLDATATAREGALEAALNKSSLYETDAHVWVKTSNVLQLTNGTSVTPVKAVRGDKDAGFHEEGEFLGTATRTNPTSGIETKGWVDYRLTVYNGDESMKGLIIGDVLPSYNHPDGRGSKWDAVMDGITSLKVNGADVEAEDYTLYYYTGENAPAALETAMKEDGHTAAVLEAAGWSKAEPVDKAGIRAFVVLFADTVQLNNNNYIVMTYHTLTENMPKEKDGEFASRAAFENAMNTFQFYGDGILAPQTSNTVSVTLLDKDVEVGGDLWIDEDWTGTQLESGNRRDYSKYEVIKQLISSFGVTLKDERRFGGETSTPDGKGTFDGVGESIFHYHFGGLSAATYVPGKADLYINETLNPGALKTTDAFNYSMAATVTGEEMNKIFELTTTGAGNYLSDDPDNMPEANALDNNFSGEDGSYSMKPFYVRYSNAIDNSKDIGFKMYRDLLIEKVDSADLTKKLAGVKFKVYGPFDDKGENVVPTDVESLGEALKFTKVIEDGKISYRLDENGEFTELPTGEDGKLQITDLNWWKEYVIEEVEPAKGYTLKGAQATVTDEENTVIVPMKSENNKDIDGHWIFRLPGTGKVTRDNEAVISNRRLGHITIRKTVDKFRKTDDDVNTLFVFDVQAMIDGKSVYSDVVSMSFTGLDTEGKTIEITNLPVGAEVTVTEIYAGNEYNPSVTGPITATVPVPDAGETTEIFFNFNNSYNDRLTTSGAVVNHFKDNGNGGWVWTKLNENTGPIYAIPPEEEQQNDSTVTE